MNIDLNDVLVDLKEVVDRGPQHTCRDCGAASWSDRCEACDEKHTTECDYATRMAWAPQRLRWATFGAPHLAERVRDARAIARAKAAVAERPRSIVFLGAAGVGKTSLSVATADAMSERGPRPVFVDALSLSTARQRARLGDEAEEVAAAMRARLVVIDELGRGRASAWDATPDLLLRKYNDDRPMIITTPMATVDALCAQLADDGLSRRVFEGAVVISMTAKGTK